MERVNAGSGRKRLFRDSKIGNILNGAAVAAALYIADALRGVDLSPLPDAIEPLAFGAVGTIVGLLASWASPRTGRADGTALD